MSSIIPRMINPLGRYWDQPSSDDMLFDDKHVIMSTEECSKLLEYSTSIPSGKYAGKMWKSFHRWKQERKMMTCWCLRWYEDADEPGLLNIMKREILIVD